VYLSRFSTAGSRDGRIEIFQVIGQFFALCPFCLTVIFYQINEKTLFPLKSDVYLANKMKEPKRLKKPDAESMYPKLSVSFRIFSFF